MGVRITDLPIASSSSDTDILPVVQEGTTKQMQKSTLFTDVNNSITEINTDLGELDDKIDEAIAEFTAPLTYKGEVTNVSDLPSGATQGDIYTVTSVNKNYIWNGTQWVEYSPTMDLSSLTNTIMTTPVAKSQEITDCAGVNGKLDVVDGDTYQATRDGKNLINEFSIETLPTGVTIDNEGWITVTKDNTSGSSITYVNLDFLPNLNLKKNTNYYFVTEIKSISRVLTNSTLVLSNLNETSRKGQFAEAVSYYFNQLTANDIKIDMIPTRDSFDGCTTFSRSYIAVRNGDNISITFRISVVEQQPTAETFVYEPYGVSPSPDYPSDIQNVGESGSIDFKIQNKNLFDKNNITTGKAVNFNNGNLSTASGYTSSDFIEVKPQTQYYINHYLYSSNSYGYAFYDKNKNYISGNKMNVHTITSPANAYYLRFGVSSNTNINTLQVEKGSTETSYVEHQEQIISFPLTAGQLLHKDDFLADDGIHNLRGTLIFNGTESFSFNDTNECVFINILNRNFKLKNDNRINCNRLKAAAKDVEGFNSVSTSSLYFKINGCTTLQQYKDKLAEWNTAGVPLTFEDDYIEPIVTPYTTEQAEVYYQLQNLLLYKGYTLIECTDTMQPDIQVDYLYNNNINNYYGSRLDAIEARLRALEQS